MNPSDDDSYPFGDTKTDYADYADYDVSADDEGSAQHDNAGCQDAVNEDADDGVAHDEYDASKYAIKCTGVRRVSVIMLIMRMISA